VAPDRGDFTPFVTAHATPLLRSAYLLTGDRQGAEDLLQDTLERLYVAWPRVDDPVAYARTTLTRTAINRWRTRRRRPEVLLPEHDDRDDGISGDGSDARATHAVLMTALAGLPRRQRAVIVLRYLEDLTEADTAATLGCSVGTVKSQAHRALKSLRAVLGADHHLLTTRRS